jgi:hypothetical protein
VPCAPAPFDAIYHAAAPLYTEGRRVVVGFDVDTADVLEVFDLSALDPEAPVTWPAMLRAVVEAVQDAPEPLRSELHAVMNGPSTGLIAAGYRGEPPCRSIAEIGMMDIDL